MPQFYCIITKYACRDTTQEKLVRLFGGSYGGSKCYIMWLDAEGREECNGTKIMFIALSIRKLLMRSVRQTQCKQTQYYSPVVVIEQKNV